VSERVVTILGVDDEHDILDVYQSVLASDDVIVTTARSFAEFKAIFESRDIDIVITDHNMGEFNSRDVVAFIKASNKPNTLIYICSSDPPRDVFCDTVKELAKPIDFDFLINQIENKRNSLK